MNGYLLDANVISQLAPGKRATSTAFAAWIEHQAENDRLFLSCVTVSEIRKGISKLRRQGAIGRADALDTWLSELVSVFSDKILPVDVTVALAAGDMADAVAALRRDPGFADILIAATTRVHKLTVLTHNIRHFESFDIGVEQPVGDH